MPQEDMNPVIEGGEPSVPLFTYYLVDYYGERIISSAPISVGDYVSVRLSDNTVLREKKVLRITHVNEPQNVGKQILTPYVALEP